MNFQKIKVPEQDRKLVSNFMGENYPIEIDFNWIMPVVEKIESLGGYTKIMDNGMCIDGDLVIERWGDTKIEGTFKTVIEFIKWYNSKQ